MKLYAVGPGVMRSQDGIRHYLHDDPVLHRVYIEDIGGIGEGNAGEFLVETPCGYHGWVRTLNRNTDKAPTCEACLNHAESRWLRWPLPPGAKRAEKQPSGPPGIEDYPDDFDT